MNGAEAPFFAKLAVCSLSVDIYTSSTNSEDFKNSILLLRDSRCYKW